MLAATSPFFINNYIVSGNPLFPLLNKIFRSPYASFLQKGGVNEMQPFQAGLAELAQSIFNFFVRFPTILVALFLILINPWSKQLRYDFGKAFLLLMSVITGLLFYGFLFAPYGLTWIEDRHFWGLIILSYIFSFYVFSRICHPKLEKIAWVLCLMLAVGSSHLDVAIKKFMKSSFTKNFSSEYKERKPFLALNDYVETNHLLEEGDTLLGLTVSNSGYFLSSGTYWHRTISYPIWKWPIESMVPRKWQEMIDRYRIGYIVFDESSEKIRQDLLKAGMIILVKKQKNGQLYATRKDFLMDVLDSTIAE